MTANYENFSFTRQSYYLLVHQIMYECTSCRTADENFGHSCGGSCPAATMGTLLF